MATLNREGKHYRILFVDPASGRRKTLRTGIADQKVARQVYAHVEALLAARAAGTPPPAPTAAWLAGIGPDLKERLARAGLIEAERCPTLGEFLADFMKRQTHLRPASRTAYGQAARNLLDFFGPDCRLSDINPGRAGDFRKWLLAEARSKRQRNKPKPLAPATAGKRLAAASSFFNDAVRRKLISENPFLGLQRPPANNPERDCYVPVEVIERLIEHFAPNAEWRLLLAMARYLGARVPSEPFSMTWDCVLWDENKLRIPSPKTTVHGKSFRLAPLLPQVRKHLEEVFAQAPEGSTYIFHHLRQRESARAAEQGYWNNLNLRTQLRRMLRRAGIKPWPRLWHNLRASAQTDLANRFPAHVVCEWLGNTTAIASKHYLRVTEEHFRQAIAGTDSGTPLAQIPAQPGNVQKRQEWHDESEVLGASRLRTNLAEPGVSGRSDEVEQKRFELSTSSLRTKRSPN